MASVLARLHVDRQGRVTGQVPPGVPPGDYEAPLVVDRRDDGSSPGDERPEGGLNAFLARPPHQTPWDDSISLRREDMYGDDGP